MLVIEKLTI